MATIDTIVSPGLLSALVVRSEINIRRSRALVAAARETVRLVRRERRPKLAGGSDGLESTDGLESAAPHVGDQRVIRTWAKVKAGALPTDGARRRWVGPGQGEHCDGCGDPVDAHETEMQIDFRNALLLRFHVGCFKTWESFDGQRR